MLPQLIFIGMSIVGLGLSICDHGKPRSPENALLAFISLLINYILLIWGGFFDCFLK